MAHHSRSPLAGRRVLLVEDATDIRDVLALLLRADGAEVRTAACAGTAMEVASTWEFDVLLTDIGLPDLPGDHLIREISGMKNGRPRLVAITGFGEPHVTRAREAGADTVFVKPLDWSVLREHLVAEDEALAA
jgi:DNA-binding response OmpR family regulator